MRWIKATVVGALAALVMFIILMFGIHGSGLAPFNQPPSAVFLEKLGIPPQPLALIVHFLYGMFWSIVLVALLGSRTNAWTGMGLGVFLWLILLAIYAPIMGWGFFGVAGPGHDLPADHPLYIGSSLKLIVVGLVIHLIYGGLVGWLDRVWIDLPKSPAERTQKTEQTSQSKSQAQPQT